MSRRRSLAFITVAVGALLGALGVFSASAAPPVGTDASEVSHWNQVAATTLAAFPGPNGGAPPAFQINMGMAQGAVYDAVNAIGPKKHRPYLLKKRAGAKASIDAAVATAAYDVLSELVSTAPERAPFPGRAGLLNTLSSEYAASLNAIDDNSFKRQGIAVGHRAAEAMLDAREGDGRFGPSPWVSNPAPGHWQPLVSGGAPVLDPTPWVGNVRPFLIQTSSQFRSAPPPALNSQQWATEFNEVKSLGRATGSTRTDEQTYIARWWQSAPILSWNEVARQLIARSGLDAADSARLLALQNLSGADAAINCWNDKYHFDFWRPWNAIPRALEDGNPATAPDATWTALLTAPYPEWTSGHNCLDAAHVAVLRMFFGDDPVGGPFQITSTFVNPGGPAVRTFDTFTQPLAELIEARIWAGLHYRSADVEGQRLGRNVANYGAANYFQPVGAHPKVRSDAVTEWNANAGKAAIAACIAPTANPLHESRMYAMTHVAIHDALNAIDRRSRPYAFSAKVTRRASPDAAVAAAARDVLVTLLNQLPNPPFPPACGAAGVASVEADYAAALGAIPDGRAKTRGIEVGQAAAAAILALRAADGSDTPFIVTDYPQGTNPGEYRFTPGTPFVAAPGWADVTPFVLRDSSQFRPGPPDAVTSRKYTADFNEVKRLGGDDITTPSERNAEQTEIALFWVESSPLQWNRIARAVSADTRLDLWEQARLFGLLNMALADGYIGSFEAKYHYNYWRPVTAIQTAATDGNPNTSADPTWTPLVQTPPIPDYDSGHSVQGGAASKVLKRFFGTDHISFRTCSLTLPPGSTCTDPTPVLRRYTSFTQAAAENGLSRILVGFHFRKAVDEGIEHGRKIGNRAVDRFLRPADDDDEDDDD